MNIRKTLASSLLCIPLTIPAVSFGAQTTFSVTNSVDSINKVVTVMESAFTFQSASNRQDPECNGTLDLAPYTVSTGVSTKIPFSPPNMPDSCFDTQNGLGPEQFSYLIKVVDKVTMLSGTCQIDGPYMTNPNDINYADHSIMIVEQPDRFYCIIMNGSTQHKHK